MLLFIVVFYAYPMKFMFTRLISGTLLGLGPGIDRGHVGGERPAADGHLQRRLRRALCARSCCCTGTRCGSDRPLELDALDVYDARASVARHAISVADRPAVDRDRARCCRSDISRLPGLMFFLMGPAHGMFGYFNGRARARLEYETDR